MDRKQFILLAVLALLTGINAWATRDPYQGDLLDGETNPYKFVENDPINKVDRLGLWPTQIHRQILEKAFSETLSPLEVATLRNASVNVDSNQFGDSFKHAMRDPGQDIVEARKKWWDFIQERLRTAECKEKAGDHFGALSALGEGMHALADSTSPAHWGFHEWNNPLLHPFKAAEHIGEESTITPGQLNISSTLLQNYYKQFTKDTAR